MIFFPKTKLSVRTFSPKAADANGRKPETSQEGAKLRSPSTRQGMSTERLEAHGFVMESPTSPLEEDLPPLESADAEIEAQLEGLPSSLRSADPTLALEELAELIDAAEGEWATALGSFVRSAGIVSDLVDLIDHDDAEIYALAMRVLGNLCSDAVDPQSSATKEVVRTYNGFSRLLPHCFNEDPVVLMYTLGAIQNLCTNIEYAKMVTPPLRERIREVAEYARATLDGMPQAGLLAHYAEGILVNIAMCERKQSTSHTPAASQKEVDRRARARREWRRARQQRQRQPSAVPPEPPGAPPLESTTAQRRPEPPPSGGGGQPPPSAPMHPGDAERLKQQGPRGRLAELVLPSAVEWRVAEWSPFSSHCASPYSTSPCMVRMATADSHPPEAQTVALPPSPCPTPKPGAGKLACGGGRRRASGRARRCARRRDGAAPAQLAKPIEQPTPRCCDQHSR